MEVGLAASSIAFRQYQFLRIEEELSAEAEANFCKPPVSSMLLQKLIAQALEIDQLFHSGFRCGGNKELDKRANVTAAATAKNALITMLKHIREQVTSGVEELSALMTMLPLHSAIVSSCLKLRLLIESQSWGFEEMLFQFEPTEDGEVQFHPSTPIVVEKSPSVVAVTPGKFLDFNNYFTF
nr:GDP-L-galactose phosphorylase 2 [Tanacetum cinerariifolium]